MFVMVTTCLVLMNKDLPVKLPLLSVLAFLMDFIRIFNDDSDIKTKINQVFLPFKFLSAVSVSRT